MDLFNFCPDTQLADGVFDEGVAVQVVVGENESTDFSVRRFDNNIRCRLSNVVSLNFVIFDVDKNCVDVVGGSGIGFMSIRRVRLNGSGESGERRQS